ncbi:MAG: aspartate aminotransferase family protein [Acidobacteriota bacterium]
MDSILRCYGYEVLIRDLVRASGCDLFDGQGRRIVDLEAGVWCACLGHNHPRITAAVRRQLDALTHVGYRATAPIVERAGAALLDALAMKDGKCVLLSSGTEAVELALLASRRVTGRSRFVTLEGTYLGAFGASSRSRPDEWITVPGTACPSCLGGVLCAGHAARLEALNLEDVAAFVFEPGNASGLVRLPPTPLVRALAAQVKESGGLLVVDEVTTGFGRTGAWFGFEHYGLKPDSVALGKGLGNGYPVSAAAFSYEMSCALERLDFRHAQSHQDDPLGCAVANEVLAVLREEGWVERAALLGERLLDALRDLARRKGAVTDVRGRGLMSVLEFRPDGTGFSLAEVHRRLLGKGFLAGFKPSARILRFYPPLVLPEPEVDRLLAALEELL